jgi:hypothetical protein
VSSVGASFEKDMVEKSAFKNYFSVASVSSVAKINLCGLESK